LLSVLFAMPGLFALIHARDGWRRRLLSGFALVPLIAPPCVFGYAWMLLASQHGPAARMLGVLGFNADAAGPVRAAIAIATWLWPVPALLLAAAYRRGGDAAYRMARLDAGPLRAFVRGVLPALVGPLTAALGLVFMLTINESTIPPLVLTRTWPSEMSPEVLDAAMFGSPALAIAWRSWPILAALA